MYSRHMGNHPGSLPSEAQEARILTRSRGKHGDSELSQACRGGALAVPHGSPWRHDPWPSRTASPAVELGAPASHRLALLLGHPNRPEICLPKAPWPGPNAVATEAGSQRSPFFLAQDLGKECWASFQRLAVQPAEKRIDDPTSYSNNTN